MSTLGPDCEKHSAFRFRVKIQSYVLESYSDDFDITLSVRPAGRVLLDEVPFTVGRVVGHENCEKVDSP